MTKHLTKCLLIILMISFTLINLISATSDLPPPSNHHVGDDSPKDADQHAERSDWIDYGDMFTYDPATKTNREPRLKEAASVIMERAREEKKVANDETKCECSTNDHCGRRSYQIIRRLMISLSEQLKNEYSRGSILSLKVNLDDISFRMPENIKNTSDCEYLAYLHSLADQLLPSIVVYHPEPLIDVEYLSLKTGSSLLGGLLIAISLIRMSWRTRLYAFFIIIVLIALIWEYLLLYQMEIAKVEQTSNLLRSKCEGKMPSNWFSLEWILNLKGSFSFENQKAECQDYYTATRVNTLLAVHPIMVFSKLYEHTFLYALKLTANASGASVGAFFSHIPLFWIVPILIAGVFIVIFTCKYHFKYNTKTKKSKPSRQKPLNQEETKSKQLGPSNIKSLPKSEKKPRKVNIGFPIIRYGSTGNIQKLLNK